MTRPSGAHEAGLARGRFHRAAGHGTARRTRRAAILGVGQVGERQRGQLVPAVVRQPAQGRVGVEHPIVAVDEGHRQRRVLERLS